MIKDEVHFTGLTIEPREIYKPKKTFIPPPSWTRYSFAMSDGDSPDLKKLDKWILEEVDGGNAWASYAIGNYPKHIVVIYFEDMTDAVMFKMKDGYKSAIR